VRLLGEELERGLQPREGFGQLIDGREQHKVTTGHKRP
jgi:hypothetical protein